MRYERKFIVEENFYNKIIPFLLENKFLREYPSRNINSIYYDSFDFRRYFESEDGISNRSKLRLRFYDDPNEIKLEKKIKNSEIGRKIINSSKSFKNKNWVKLKIKNCDNKIHIFNIPKMISLEFPSLLVSYRRDYFTNKDENIRITIDYKIRFAKMRNGYNIIKKPQNLNSGFSVLEGKYSSYQETNPVLNKISDKYSLELSRCSKYCYGIDACY